MFAIITENDISKWDDQTGIKYHFPARYLDYLKPGTKVIYYKGRMTDKRFLENRMSKLPHYFGVATIGKVLQEKGTKNYYATIENYSLFLKPVPFKINGKTLETIPNHRKTNYWRNGVRPINEVTYNRIVSNEYISYIKLNDLRQNELESYRIEGGKKKIYTTIYERDKKSRDKAVAIHGYACMVCNFNFSKVYGTWGEGYVHVHHLYPLSIQKERGLVNPKTDLVVVCANCHSMIHRKKDKVLTIKELKAFMKKRT
jgi:predicted HNH restriction endonuclease